MDNDVSSVKRTRNGYLYVSVVALLVYGLVYAWSIFATSLSADFGWDGGALQTTFNIALICFCLAQLGASFVIKGLGYSKTLVIAGAIALAGFLVSAFFADKSIWGIYGGYGVLCGAGCGMAYITIISVVNSWFADKIGFSSGIMMMGFGFGSLILGTPAATLVDHFGLRAVFVAIAIITMAISLALAFYLKPAPENIGQFVKPAGGDFVDESTYEDDRPWTVPSYFVYYAWALLIISIGVTLIGGSRQGAAVVGIEGMFSAMIVGLVSTMNGLARPLFGALFDKAGLKTVLLSSTVLNLIASALLAFSFSTSTSITYIIAALLVGLGYGAIPVIASGYMRQRFGAKNYARNLGLTNISAAIASFLAIGLVALVSPDGTSANASVWICFTAVAAVATVFGVAFCLLYKRESRH
ncbi:MAG: MFS transporter [Eggerthellaceae bacterium]|nr:MFS transporter [Eggerthellaceae bacterium]